MSSSAHGHDSHGDHGDNKRAQRIIVAVPALLILVVIAAAVYALRRESSGDWATILPLPSNMAAAGMSPIARASEEVPDSSRVIKLPLSARE